MLMKPYLASIALILLALVPVHSGDYGRLLVHPDEPGRILKPAIEDAVRALSLMTGQEFQSEPGGPAAARGIILALSDDGHLPEDLVAPLKEVAMDKEPFVLFSDSSDRLLVVANDQRGLAHGLYTYLEKLGCRWYLPGGNWEMIPRRDDITMQLNEFVAPDFRTRDFFGTGAFGIRTPVDPELVVTADYDQWRRRNRWGGEFTVGGHAWEGFVTKNETLFQDRPEFRAERNGQRDELYRADGKLREQIKFCVSNQELIRLFAEDRAQVFRDRPDHTAVSIEPADGGGHCECKDCLAIGNGSVSDRVFYFANEVAKIVGQEFPDKILTHYAYHEHADVPSFDLEPNLYVQVVPTAFQSTRYSPVELLKVWGEKKQGRNLGTYDYWILPDSNRDMPSFDFIQKPGETIRLWKNAGLDTFNIETTFGGAPMGMGLYLASQIAWDTDFDETAALEEFYESSFGPAAVPMRRMLERWASSYYPLPPILGASFVDMNEALQLSKDAPIDVRKRVLDFANYLQFVRLYQEYRELPKGDELREANARDAIKLLWRTYFSYLVHVFRVQWMIRLNDEKDAPWIQEFDMRSPEEKGWQEVLAEGPVREEETLAFVADGLKKYAEAAGEIRRFSSDLVPLKADSFRPGESFPTQAFQTYGYTRFTLIVPEGVTELRIRARALAEPTQDRPAIRLRFFNNTELAGGGLVEAELSTSEKEIVLPTPDAGTYELLTLSMARWPFEITLPEVPLAITKAGIYPPQGLTAYFFVPAGVEQVIVRGGTPLGGDYRVRIEDEHGTELPVDYLPAGTHHYYIVENPDPERNQIWQLVNFRNHDLVELIGVPQSLALSRETLLIPRELAE